MLTIGFSPTGIVREFECLESQEKSGNSNKSQGIL